MHGILSTLEKQMEHNKQSGMHDQYQNSVSVYINIQNVGHRKIASSFDYLSASLNHNDYSYDITKSNSIYRVTTGVKAILSLHCMFVYSQT